MKKLSVVIILLFWTVVNVEADGNLAVTQSDNQVIRDEGYGNDDVEYYNSENDRVNDEGDFDSQKNASTNEAVENDAH